MTTTVVTQVGLAAALNANQNGLQIQIGSFQLGSSLITPVDTMTGVTNPVYVGSLSQITYTTQPINNNQGVQITFIITLDQSVGTFEIGNIGLFLTNGTLFSITGLSSLDNKIATNAAVSPIINGNIISYPIVVAITNATNIIDLTTITPAYLSLPTLATDASLPAVNTGPYNAYLVNEYLDTGIAAISVDDGAEWVQIRGVKNTSDSGIILPGLSSTTITEGQAVAWSGAALVPWDPSTNDVYIGVKGTGSLVYRNGVFTISTGTPYTVGSTYYCGTGVNAGILTSTPPDLSSSTSQFLAVGYANATNSLILNAECSQFLSEIGSNYYLDSSTAANTITIVLPLEQMTLPIGYTFKVKIANTNTGSSTISSNILNAAIILPNGNSIQPGNVIKNGIFTFIWNGADFVLTNPYLSYQNNGESFITDTSVTPNSITANLSPAPSSYDDFSGILFTLVPNNSNTGPATINLNGLGGIPIYQGGVALSGGELLVNSAYKLLFRNNIAYIVASTIGAINISDGVSGKQAINYSQITNGSLNSVFNSIQGNTTALLKTLTGANANPAFEIDSTPSGGNKYSFYAFYNSSGWGFTNLTSNTNIMTGDSKGNIAFAGTLTAPQGFNISGNVFFTMSGTNSQLNLGSGTYISAPSSGGSMSFSAGSTFTPFVITGNNLSTPGNVSAAGTMTVGGTTLSLGYQTYLKLLNNSTISSNSAAVEFYTNSQLNLNGSIYSLTYNGITLASFSQLESVFSTPTTFNSPIVVNSNVSVEGNLTAYAATASGQVIVYDQITNASLNAQFTSVTIVNGQLVIRSGTGQASIYSDANTSDLVLKAGGAGAVLNSSGDLSVPGTITSAGSQVVTFGDYALNASQTGSVTLPNGLIFKWGVLQSGGAGGATVPFDEAFPNVCIVVVPVCYAMQVSSTFCLDSWNQFNFTYSSYGSSKLNPSVTGTTFIAIGR